MFEGIHVIICIVFVTLGKTLECKLFTVAKIKICHYQCDLYTLNPYNLPTKLIICDTGSAVMLRLYVPASMH